LVSGGRPSGQLHRNSNPSAGRKENTARRVNKSSLSSQRELKAHPIGIERR
jgi:hypothetical protein